MAELQTYVELADALRAWVRDFAGQEYRDGRLGLWRAANETTPFSPVLDFRFIVDRRLVLDGGLDAWFVDLWMLESGANLAHGLQLYLCPTGLDGPPLPQSDSVRSIELRDPRGDEGTHLLAFPGVVEDTQNLRFQALVVSRSSTFRGRASVADTLNKGHRTIRIEKATRRDSVIARLLIVALRQEQADQDAFEWLVQYAEGKLPASLQLHARDVVSRAVQFYLFPASSPERYFWQVAQKLALASNPDRALTSTELEAEALGIPARTLYHWKAQGLDIDDQLNAYRESKRMGDLVSVVMERRGGSHVAARAFVRRQLATGKTLDDLTRELFTE